MAPKQKPEYVGKPRKAVEAFQHQRTSARQRGIPFLFTFEEWWAWWQTDNRWANRGCRRDSLIMARFNDEGPLSPTNVYCTTLQERAIGTEFAGKPRAASVAFQRHRQNAKTNGIPFLFSFEEWWAWWQTDNRWANRGNGPDNFVMARFKGQGPYSSDNVFCTTHKRITLEQYPDCVGQPKAAIRAYQQHRINAAARGVPFLFTFEEWWAWWQIDDRWANRGKCRDNFVMARFNDEGPYETGNVYLATMRQNQKDVSSARRSVAMKAARARKVFRVSYARWKSVITPDGWFASVTLAAKHHGVFISTVSKRIKRGDVGWKYAGPERAIGQHQGASPLGRSNESKPRKLKARQLSFDFDIPNVERSSM